MHSPNASTSALPALDNHDVDKISAYYSLAFPNFTYYLQTLTVTIGRRPIPSKSSSDASLVDVDLGPLKSVSRMHARIEYEEEEERFVLVVLGRNGAWVDGIWAGSGSKVPLGARSQIQIATRTFHFILPPPPAPEPASLSPPPSTARQRSPSVDITSLSPGSSCPASPRSKSMVHDKPAASVTLKPVKSSKKRKKPEPDQPIPENMPPKPLPTYAVMCYRAIKSLGGKATLQEVVQWMIDNYEWYKLNVGGPWENSIRHNLSSNRAFRNAAKSSEERGKGFLWGIDPQFESTLQDQDAKVRLAEEAQQQGQSSIASGSQPSSLPTLTKEPRVRVTNGRKEKNIADLPPAFTRSPKVINGTAASPALNSAQLSTIASNPTPAASPSSNGPSTSASSSTPNVPQIPPNVILPIIVGPLPDSHPTASATTAALAASSPSTSAVLTAPPIVLHAGVLVLNPAIFSHLTRQQLRELEGLGAQKALEILQGHIVRFLKETKKLESATRSKGRVRGRGRGRGGGASRGGGKGQSVPEAGVNDADTVSIQVQEGHLDAAAVNQRPTESAIEAKPTSQPQTTRVNGADTGTDVEEPVSKKRKLDDAEKSAVNGNADVEVDVVGT